MLKKLMITIYFFIFVVIFIAFTEIYVIEDYHIDLFRESVRDVYHIFDL